MGNEQNTIVDSVTSNNHILGYKDGGWEVELDATLGTHVVGTSGVLPCSTFTNPINIPENCNEWPSGSARFFLWGTTTIRGMD